MVKLRDKIEKLENKIRLLEDKVTDLTNNTETKRLRPETRVSQLELNTKAMPSTGTGLGKLWGGQGNVFWNDADAKRPPFGQQPSAPTKGYNKHGHSRYAGGALDISTLELVEYETHEETLDSLGYPVILDYEGNPVNKHCQAYWNYQPNIATENGIQKIGLLDIQFDSSSGKWVAGSGNIDVKKTYLVQYIWKDPETDLEVPEGTEGAIREIKEDENGNEMKSPLLYDAGDEETVAGRNENLNKSNVYWDKDAECWRLYAVFKPYPEEEEE